MSKYDERRFYWLQLKEDFFEDDAISWLEEQPNGKEYSLFYLKLCLKSLKTSGIMIRRVGDILVPYDYKKLAEITRTHPDTVLIALKLLTEIGLIKVLENGELYLSQVENLIGSQSYGAFKKQQQRQRAEQKAIQSAPAAALPDASENGGGHLSENRPPKIEIEIEIDKEIDIDIEKEREKKRVDYQEIINAYNDTCVSLPSVNKLSDARRKAIKARLNSGYSIEDIKRCFDKAEKSSFLKGKNNRNWHADFDWLMKDANIAKVLDGKYDDYDSNGTHTSSEYHEAGGNVFLNMLNDLE